MPETSRDPLPGCTRGGPEPLSKIKRNAHLKTVLRVDPNAGVGVYTESARVQKLLEGAGLSNRIVGNERGAYFLIPPERHALVADVVATTFTPPQKGPR